MQFICMDIVGPISPVSSKRNRFCLTVVNMLTGYTMAVAIPSKSAETISPFVLMFSRDPITPFLSLLEPSPQYWGERGGHLHLDALQQLYAVTAENLKRAREKENTETETNLQNDLKIGDLVLVRNVNSGVFEPKYSPNYRIIAFHRNNHIAVKAPDSKVQM